jgi:hypothetical protein
MNGRTLKILRKVAKRGEVSLATAIRLVKPRYGNHLDQYPLALLIEEGYLGMTIEHTPPPGAEAMREFSLATTLHMFTLPKNEHGEIHYLGIKSTGSLDPATLHVFMKAKGALYLDEHRQTIRDRFWSLIMFILGFISGVLGPIVSGWIKG